MLSRSSKVIFKKNLLKSGKRRCILKPTQSKTISRSFCTTLESRHESYQPSYEKSNFNESIENIMKGTTYFAHNVYNNSRKRSISDAYRPGRVLLDPRYFEKSLKGTIVSFRYDDEIRTGYLIAPKHNNLWLIEKIDDREVIVPTSDIVFQWPNPEIPNDLSNTELTYKMPYMNCDASMTRGALNDVRALLSRLPKNVPATVWQMFYPFCISGSRFSIPLDFYSIAISLFGPDSLTDIHIFAAFELLRSNADKFIYNGDGFYCKRIVMVSSNLKSYSIRKKAEMFVQLVENSIAEEQSFYGLYPYIKMVGKRETDKIVNIVANEFDSSIQFNSHDLYSFRLLTDYALLRKDFDRIPQVYEDILKPLGYENEPKSAFDVLLKLGIFRENDNPHLLRWGHSLTFDDVIELDVLSAMKKDEVETDRLDFTNHHIYSLTNTNTDLIENGISFVVNENNIEWTYFHIADVAYYVFPNSRIEREARVKAVNINLPERNHNIFPKELSEYMSLRPGAKRRAISIGVVLNEDGSVKDYKIVKSMVEKVHRLNFDELDEILESKDEADLNPKLSQFNRFHQEIIQKLSAFSSKRTSYRLKNHAILSNIPSPDVRIDYDDQGRPLMSIRPKKDPFKGANGILTEFMLTAGEVTAKVCNSKNVPVVYETQDLLNNDQFDSHFQSNDNVFANYMNSLDKLQAKSLSLNAGKHHGYGLNEFTNISTPITRYFDLMTLFQLRSTIEEKRYVYSQGYINIWIPRVQNIENEAKELVTNVNRYNVLDHLEHVINEEPNKTFSVLITHPKSVFRPEATGILREFGLVTNVRSKRILKKGDTIDVVVKSVDKFYDSLILEDSKSLTE